jgi:hypothetical protein
MTITNGLIQSNSASGVGGGINNSPGASLTLTSTVVSDNTTGASNPMARGGGIMNSGTLTLQGAQVLSNKANAPGGMAQGGGIYNDTTGTATLTSSDVEDNVAKAPAGTAAGGGIYNANTPSSVVLNSSEVQENAPDQCAGPGTPIPGC